MIGEIFQYEHFEDPEREKAFRAQSNARNFRAHSFFLCAGVIIYAAYAALDWMVAGANAETFVFVRLGLIAPAMAVTAILFTSGRFRGRENTAFMVYMTLMSSSILYMCLQLERPVADIYPFGMIVVVFSTAMMLLPSFRMTLALSITVTFSLTVAVMLSDASSAAAYSSIFYVLTCSMALAVGMFFHEKTERSQHAYECELEKTIASLQDSEQRAMNLYHEAKQAEKAKSEFLAVVSHELRTPMNAIIGFSEIISKGMLGTVKPPQYQEYAVHINDSGQQLLCIINDILDISRAEMGKIAFEHRVFDLSSAVGSAIAACSANGKDNGVTVVRADPRLRDVEIEGDETRLLQAMTNIIGNAIKFSHDNGTVIVDLSFTPMGGLRFSAADSGIGISEEDIEQIRQPFQQAESAFARKNGGLGLGLAICNIVAGAHEGVLQIESTLGVGTTVSITLPPDRVVSTTKPQAAVAR